MSSAESKESNTSNEKDSGFITDSLDLAQEYNGTAAEVGSNSENLSTTEQLSRNLSKFLSNN